MRPSAQAALRPLATPLQPIPCGSLCAAEFDLRELFRSYDPLPHATVPAPTAPYALLPDLAYPAKPIVYPSIAALARRIHRDRRGEAIVLRPRYLEHGGRVRAVTEVLAEDQFAARHRRIGFAWTAGRPLEALRHALDAAYAATAEA